MYNSSRDDVSAEMMAFSERELSESDHLSQRRPAAANPRVKGSVSEGAGVSESDRLGPSERIRVCLRRPGRRRSPASPSPTTGPPLGSVRGCAAEMKENPSCT